MSSSHPKIHASKVRLEDKGQARGRCHKSKPKKPQGKPRINKDDPKAPTEEEKKKEGGSKERFIFSSGSKIQRYPAILTSTPKVIQARGRCLCFGSIHTTMRAKHQNNIRPQLLESPLHPLNSKISTTDSDLETKIPRFLVGRARWDVHSINTIPGISLSFSKPSARGRLAPNGSFQRLNIDSRPFSPQQALNPRSQISSRWNWLSEFDIQLEGGLG